MLAGNLSLSEYRYRYRVRHMQYTRHMVYTSSVFSSGVTHPNIYILFESLYMALDCNHYTKLGLPWLLNWNRQEIYIYIYINITWRLDKNHQENMQFSWQLGYAAK